MELWPYHDNNENLRLVLLIVGAKDALRSKMPAYSSL